jgi:site-specific recombinase XerC
MPDRVLPPGIYPTRTGFRVVACIGRGKGKRREKAFPAGTSERKMVRWQEEAERDLRSLPEAKTGSLAADLPVYLAARATMKTKATRERHLRLWIAALGGARHRDTVTPLEVRTQLETWLAAGHWANQTVVHLRTALGHFYTLLNGKAGYNPVRGVPEPKTKRKPRKPLSYPLFEAILRHLPTTYAGVGRKPNAVMHGQMVARLRVLAYVGLPHTQIKALRPTDLFPAERLVRVQGRDKGAGTDDVYMPLGARGLAALQEFFACGAQGDFRNETMRDLFMAGAAALGRTDLTPYDLRSLFAITVLRSSKNRSALKDLMQHEDEATSAIYAEEAIRDELRAALTAFDAVVVDFRCGTLQESDDVPTVTH